MPEPKRGAPPSPSGGPTCLPEGLSSDRTETPTAQGPGPAAPRALFSCWCDCGARRALLLITSTQTTCNGPRRAPPLTPNSERHPPPSEERPPPWGGQQWLRSPRAWPQTFPGVCSFQTSTIELGHGVCPQPASQEDPGPPAAKPGVTQDDNEDLGLPEPLHSADRKQEDFQETGLQKNFPSRRPRPTALRSPQGAGSRPHSKPAGLGEKPPKHQKSPERQDPKCTFLRQRLQTVPLLLSNRNPCFMLKLTRNSL